MDTVERLTLEASQEDTMLASEHRHRYEFAATLCSAQRVLDLCCGSGYGTAVLAAQADTVTGIDNDAATIETARVTIGREFQNVSFKLADAVAALGGEATDGFDALVCFEGLEHLVDIDGALAAMRAQALRGLRIIASVPNGKLFEEHNPFHVTSFGYDEAMEAFAAFPSTSMVPQFLAEGSLICPAGAQAIDVKVTLGERYEPEYANHFIFCVNFEPAEVDRALNGRIQLSTSPVFNRWAEDLKRGAWALRRENARLGRARLGKSGSAAASAVVRLAESDARLAALRRRCELAEARVHELEAVLTRADTEPSAPESSASAAGGAGRVTVPAATEPRIIDGAPAPLAPGDDPNSWEQRRRRAADYLIPWIEQTVPLQGLTVLEYGCGNAAVSCALAERAGQVIGVDIDPAGIELGQEQTARRGLRNITLELHSLESIADAVSARQGAVDVFLLYAVLEHMTVAERLAVLRLAQQVVKPDGAIIVCETPNRLIYFDHHTAQMPFFHLLPDELALKYYERSGRQDFKAALELAASHGAEAALEAVVRWGRGVSFHEFEVAFGDLSRHVIASNYDPLLFPERPVHPDEVVLSRYLDRSRPDLAPVWSRYWLDLILSPREIERRGSFLRPWSADTSASQGVGWTPWENLHLRGADATLRVELPHPTARLVVGVVPAADGPLRLSAGVPSTPVPLIGTVVSAEPEHTWFVDFALPAPASRIELSASRECHIVFVGYES
jgi:2-polyprenyl-3-methyl-5-hydroxy-6-metoxy-1,4-benzoquinol methylase